jgi:hypothetical protein
MTQIVVVIHRMSIVEVPVKWPGILEGGCDLLITMLPSTSRRPARLICTVLVPPSCHHSHDVVGLLQAPEIVGHAILCSRDFADIPYVHTRPIEPCLHCIPGDTDRPILMVTDQRAHEQRHLSQLKNPLQYAEA